MTEEIDRKLVVGFTGSREGLTEAQRVSLRKWLRENPPTEVHHGACVGADAEFSIAVVDCIPVGGEPPYEVAHPSNLKGTQWKECWADEVRKPLPPLDRNVNIVNAVDVMLAGPKGLEEQRSGTWSTVRYTRKVQKPLYLFWPDGSVTEERTQ